MMALDDRREINLQGKEHSFDLVEVSTHLIVFKGEMRTS